MRTCESSDIHIYVLLKSIYIERIKPAKRCPYFREMGSTVGLHDLELLKCPNCTLLCVLRLWG